MIQQYEAAALFLRSIGIPINVRQNRKWQNEFLPGISIWRGSISVDPYRCLGVDDVLHEAGHLAIYPSQFRRYASGDIDESVGPQVAKLLWKRSLNAFDRFSENQTVRAGLHAGEQEALCWGYAAQIHLGFKPVIRLQDYTESECVEEVLMMSTGSHLGIRGLQAAGMTTKKIFPKMIRWVQP